MSGWGLTSVARNINDNPSGVVLGRQNITLARDLGYLTGRDYRVLDAQPVDMFPWTRHVEAIILLQNMKR